MPRAFLRLCGLLIGFVLATVAFSPPATAATSVHLSGTVTNTDGVAQSGSLYVKRVGANSASGVGFANGTFAWDWNVDANPEGDYRIFVRSSTMDGTERWYVAGDPTGTTEENLATPVHLGPGAPDLSFDMVMPAIAKVSGRVVDTSNDPVPGATVVLSENGSIRPQVTTGPDGTFDLGYVQEGSWQVLAVNGPTYLRSQAGVVVPASGAVVMPDFVLHRAGSIAGRVTDSVTGDPIPFVNVDLWSATSHTSLGATVTDTEGRYRFEGLGDSPVVLRFLDGAFNGYTWTLNDGGDPNDWSPQTPITLDEGEDRVYDQQLVAKAPSAPPAHTLAGTVTGPGGQPLAGIKVTDGEVTDTTDRLGRWYLASSDGAHTLGFSQDWHWSNLLGSAPGWFPAFYPSVFAAGAATPVTVAGGSGPDDLQTTLRRAGRITGTVFAPAGLGVGERELWVYDGSGNLISHHPMTGGQSYSVDTPSGSPVHLVARGLTADETAVDLLPRWYGDVDTRAASTAIQVAPAETVTGKDFHLTTGLTNLSAPLMTGTPAAGQTLTATSGTWSAHTMTTFAITWLRDGAPVGTGLSYLVTAADAGRTIRVRVAATNGQTSAQATSAPTVIGGLAASVALRGTSPRPGRVRITVSATAPGLTPAGTLVVKRGAKVVKHGVALVDGRAVITLRRQPAGVRRYTVTYGGSPQVLPQTSAPVRIRVR